MSVPTLRKETVWTLVYFLLSFAKTIILTPLMLTHWGDWVFCLWAVLLSARSLFLFLSDGFVRYAVNIYNLRFHEDEAQAGEGLADHFSFLSVFNLLIALLVFVVLQSLPMSVSLLFDVSAQVSAQYGLPLLVAAYLLVCGVQNGQRMLAATREARGLVRHNLQFESLLLSVEIVLLSLLLVKAASFSLVVWTDILLIGVFVLAYQSVLYRQATIRGCFRLGSIVRGGHAFARAGRLYLGNFFEKLSTDGLVLLLSLFRFPKVTIAAFSALRTMVNAPLLAQNLLLTSYTPRLQQLFARKDAVSLRDVLILARFYLGSVLLAGMILCVPLYQPVFLAWTRGTLPFDAHLLSGMLLWAVFSIYGNAYLFVLKGLNLLREFWLLMALRCLLLLTGLFFTKGQGTYFVSFLWITELLISGLLLPRVLHVFWKRNLFPLRYIHDWLLLLVHVLSALLLSYFLY